MSPITVLASEISNLTDARYFSAQGVEWIGFNLDENNPDAISQSQFLAIQEWITGPKMVGEFSSASDADMLNHIIVTLRLKAVKVGQFMQPEELKKINPGISVFYKFIIEDLNDTLSLKDNIEKLKTDVHYFELDFSKNNIKWIDIRSNQTFLNALSTLMKNYPVFLAIELDSADISDILSLNHLCGISLKGGSELKTGMKSFEAYDAIFEYLEENND